MRRRGAIWGAVGALPLVALAIAMSGCSVCAGSGCTTSAQDLAKEVRQQFDKYARSHGLPPLPPVTCPNAIRNETGAKTICYAKGDLGGGTKGILPITATVTSANGSTVNFDFHAGKPRPLGS